MALTDTEIRRSKPGEKPYKIFDSGGLHLMITPTGGKLWRWKYRFDGAEKLMALGRYPEISLADARERQSDGRVEVDECYICGPEEEVPGRLNLDKTLVVVAAEEDGSGIGRIRMRQVSEASSASLLPFVKESVVSGSTIHTDGWLGYSPLESKGFPHQITYLKGKPDTASELPPRVHLVISVLKDGCWARIRVRSATSIWTSSHSASTAANHEAGASCSFVSRSRRSPSPLSPATELPIRRPKTPANHNHNHMGYGESSG